MAGSVETILSKLLEPNNTVIQEATKQLKEIFKDPSILPALCQVLGTSTVPQIRQYSAVLIRRKIQKKNHWNSLSDDMKNSIRGNILQLLVQEPDKNVRTAIGTIVGTVAKHDLPENQWPALFEFITTQVKSPEVKQVELGMFVLYTVSSDAGEQLKPHLIPVMQILVETVKNNQSKAIPYYSIRTMSELVYLVGMDEYKFIQESIPQILLVIQELIKVDEDEACECMELFDELLESEVAVLVPHVKTVVEFCLQVAAQSSLGDAVRVKAMSFISSLTRMKKNAILKHKLVDPILQVIFPILCANEDEDDDEDIEEIESHTPVQYVPQVLDTMSLHLPPKKFIPNLMPLIEGALANENPCHRKAGYIAMAVIVEGCADHIMNKHLKAVLHCVCKGLNDSDNTVRNAALFALGQFSEHLQPNISKFASELLPLLFQYLGQISQEPDKNPKGLTKIYYALEVFCENLEKEILPYLPPLMDHLLAVLKSDHIRSKELAISAIGATATAAKDAMKPYFNEIIEQLKSYLIARNSEEMKKLQLQTIDTLGILARNCGSDIFQPLAKECLQLGLNLLEAADDPDLRRCVYSLFAAISNLLKTEMSEYLEKIVNYMLLSIKSKEGVTTHFKEDTDAIAVFNEDDLIDEEDIGDEDSDDDEGQIEGVTVENAYLDEKEDAVCSLGEIAENVGAPFMPFLEQSYTQIFDLLDYPAEGIKKVTIASLSQFCICVYRVCIETGLDQTALKTMLNAIIPRFLEIIQSDIDRTVVMSAVDSIEELLTKIGQPVLEMTGATNPILTAMKKIFTHKVACQDDEDEDDDQQAEYDAMLIESAGDVLPTMAKLVGGSEFLPFFRSFLTDLLKRLKATSSVPEKSFAVGTLAEVVQACGAASAEFVDTLYPLFMKHIQDEDEEVKSNAVFAVGVLAQYGGEKLHSKFPVILKTLFDLVSGDEDNPRVLDNVCAAICRLILTNSSCIPFDKVIPAIVSFLPLKEDYEENHTVYHCLIQLYSNGNQQVIQCTPQLLSSIAMVVGTDQIKPETHTILVHFAKHINEKYPEEFQKVKATLPNDLSSKLDNCVSMVNGS
ncbi:importin-4 [Patella vulgata]|uniref:importin-4 n=1 Tax=Patella vulgata TaxID=6465 RepID=UPI00218063F6|nr:importin-4 [Patella vulgata]